MSKMVEYFFNYANSTAINEAFNQKIKILKFHRFNKARFCPYSWYLLFRNSPVHDHKCHASWWCKIKALTCLLIIHIYLINCDANIKWKMLFALPWETTQRHVLQVSGGGISVQARKQWLILCNPDSHAWIFSPSMSSWPLVTVFPTECNSIVNKQAHMSTLIALPINMHT